MHYGSPRKANIRPTLECPVHGNLAIEEQIMRSPFWFFIALRWYLRTQFCLVRQTETDSTRLVILPARSVACTEKSDLAIATNHVLACLTARQSWFFFLQVPDLDIAGLLGQTSDHEHALRFKESAITVHRYACRVSASQLVCCLLGTD